MVQSPIERIEIKICKNNSLKEKSKSELLDSLATRKPEITKFSKAQSEHAESIAGFLERSAHEATRHKINPTLLKITVDGLSASVRELESSHPKLVEQVNFIAYSLANMGI